MIFNESAKPQQQSSSQKMIATKVEWNQTRWKGDQIVNWEPLGQLNWSGLCVTKWSFWWKVAEDCLRKASNLKRKYPNISGTAAQKTTTVFKIIYTSQSSEGVRCIHVLVFMIIIKTLTLTIVFSKNSLQNLYHVYTVFYANSLKVNSRYKMLFNRAISLRAERKQWCLSEYGLESRILS